MVNILAIDACSDSCSVSLLGKFGQINRLVTRQEKPSSLLLNLCNEVLNEANISLQDIDYIAYTKGPGAFTGVRLCLGVVEGLSLAYNIPSIGFSTLAVLAYAIKNKSNYLLPILDARMGEIYWAEVVNQKIQQQALHKPDELKQFGSKYVGIGRGWDVYGDVLSKATGVTTIINHQYIDAKYLVELTYQHYLNQSLLLDKHVEALYLRNKVASLPIVK